MSLQMCANGLPHSSLKHQVSWKEITPPDLVLLRCFKSTLRKSLIHSIFSYHSVPRTVSPTIMNGTQ